MPSPKSPGRSRSRSRGRSPSRVKPEPAVADSPPKTPRGRSPGRPRSPSRVLVPQTTPPKARKILGPKTPSKKSPGRPKRSPGRPPQKKEESFIDVPGLNVKLEVAAGPGFTTVMKQTELKLHRLDSDSDADSDYNKTSPVRRGRRIATPPRAQRARTPTRQSERIAVKLSAETKKLVEEIESRFKETPTPVNASSEFSTKPNGSGVDMLDYSDVEDSSVKSIDAVHKPAEAVKILAEEGEVSILRRIGRFVGALVLPAFVLLAVITCEQNACRLNQVPIIPLEPQYYLSLESILVCLTFAVAVLLIQLLPVRKLVHGHDASAKYRNTGPHLFVINLAVLLGLAYNYPEMLQFVDNHWVHIIVGSLLLGFLVSFLQLFVPKIFSKRISALSVDVSQAVDAIRWLAVISLNFAYAFNNVQASGKDFSRSLILSASMQILYSLDHLVFPDESLPHGLSAILGSAVQPFFLTMTTRYLAHHSVALSSFHLVAITVFFVVSFYVRRASLLQKSRFEQHPDSVAFKDMETIPTASGEKILAGGWWGRLRRPDFLGDILLHWALIRPCGLYPGVFLLEPLITTIVLLKKAKISDSTSADVYGPAWERYTSKVKSRVIPGVY